MPLSDAEQRELDVLELKSLEAKAAAGSKAPEAPTNAPQTSTAAAGLQGYGQGATLGYLAQLQAAGGAVANKLVPNSMGGDDQSVAQKYDELKKEFETRDKKLQEEHPIATGVGNIAGAVGSSILIPGGAAVEGAGLLAKAGKAAATGAAYGGLSNPGGQDLTENPMANLKARLKNAGIGATIGGAAEGLIGGAGSLLKSSGKKVSDQAVLKQMAANAGQTKKILQKDELPKIGKFMQDEGLMHVGQTADDVAEHTKQILKTDGPAIGDLYKTTQKEAEVVSQALGKGRPGRVDGEKLADEIVNEAKTKFKSHANRDMVIKEIESSVAPLRDMGDNANLVDLHDFRKSLDENINWSQKANERDAVQNAYIAARNKVAKATEGAVEGIDKTLGGDPRVELLKKLNKRYSTASTVNNIATQGVARETAKALMGHGVIGGAAGTGAGYLEYQRSHDPLKALGAGIATSTGVFLGRKYGAPVGFYGGRAAQKLGQGISQITPRQISMGSVSPWMNLKKDNK